MRRPRRLFVPQHQRLNPLWGFYKIWYGISLQKLVGKGGIFVKIVSMRVVLYFSVYANFPPYFPYFLTTIGEVRYSGSSQDGIKLL